MQKFSTSNLDFASIDIYGFDLDGTLYDEFEFVSQTYHYIAEYIAEKSEKSVDKILQFMQSTWLEYGSSKRDLFQLTFEKHGVTAELAEIKECIKRYRTSEVKLNLSERVKFILDSIKKEEKNIFLVTDGDAILQRRKIETLGLGKWFSEDEIFISGDYGKEYQKPNKAILNCIEKKIKIKDKRIVYFGDRKIDKIFAEKSGFLFVYAPCMQFGNKMYEEK